VQVLLAGESWVTHSVHVKGVDSFDTSTYTEGAGRLIEAALPVTISPHDDRAERPEGVLPAVVEPGHPVLDGVPEDWPALLGYNRLTGKSAAQVLVRCDADPLLVVGRHGDGRSAAFASDCAPHWCPPPFMAWPGYNLLWGNLLRWLCGP
jgi:uncharacterized membrane protein